MVKKGKSGFTLIELLIVIAIILILIAIALPNFLEAQTRAKVTRAKADMRSLGQATAAYFNDWNLDPEPDNSHTDNRPRIWWGFGSHLLTTPVAYIGEIPIDPFPDDDKSGSLSSFWVGMDSARNSIVNQPYLEIVRVVLSAPEPPIGAGEEFWHFAHPNGCNPCNSPISAMDDQSCYQLRAAPWVYYSAGPDIDATLSWLGCNNQPYANYNPTNGTRSDGDIFIPGY
ncbi:MAG: prepilin-type N-terminal cleavage/methylation domain-containing protein [Candidatus Omnitrophica bacterium]|nr:prepilin-type N-terminal cleavage/methylation domain-containing protein [Candidatus Omnitrophota bacterium]